MKSLVKRLDGRSAIQVRPISVQYDPFGASLASVQYQQGQTIVYVSVSIVQGVPPFLKGKKTGWLVAEYEMLPSSTKKRTQRESTLNQRNSRSVEISRLLGRVFRSVIDLATLGEQTIHIDCEVLQADGGTRTAAITAATLALEKAFERFAKQGNVQLYLKDRVAAVSVGVTERGEVLVDINQEEDNAINADFNFVATQSGNVIEIQGTAEKSPLSWDAFENMKNVAIQAIEHIFTTTSNDFDAADKISAVKKDKEKFPPFSLAARL